MGNTYTTVDDDKVVTGGSTGDGAGASNTTGGSQGGEQGSSTGSGNAPLNLQGYTYDPSENAAYQQALLALQQAQANAPSYAGTYDGQLDAIYQKIMNREPFKYDVNGDMLYQQYAEQYTRLGKMAMQDTMGQAAAMTGGYGNSYASTAGNQAYQAYLQQLNDVVPELYGMAYDRYNDEGQQLLNQYSVTGEMADREYSHYQDALDNYMTNLSYLQGVADDSYARGYDNWYNSVVLATNADNEAYDREQDAIDNMEPHTLSDEDLAYWTNEFYNSLSLGGTDEDIAAIRDRMTKSGYSETHINGVLQDAKDKQAADNEPIDPPMDTESLSVWYEKFYNTAKYGNMGDVADLIDEMEQAGYSSAVVDSVYEEALDAIYSSNKTDDEDPSGDYSEYYTDYLWTNTGTYSDYDTDENGNRVGTGGIIFRGSDGKTQAFAPGINPYTGTTNPDVKNGTFSNGYQPNNIGGTPLEATDITTDITGKTQKVWKANGKYWLWVGKYNSYVEVDVSELGTQN